MKTVVILGAGAAGLAAAWALTGSGGVRVLVLDENSRPGGIAAGERLGENRIDVGGHRFYSKKPELAALMREMGEEDTPLPIRHRRQRIYYRRSYLDYPIRLNPKLVRTLGLGTAAAIGASWLKTQVFPRPETNLENFYINRFGRRLYETFFRSYTEKVCGAPPSRISPEWGKDRVRGLSVRSILFPKAGQESNGPLAPDEFYYPPKGPEQFWAAAARKLERRGARLRLNTRVTGFVRDEAGGITAVLADSGGEALRFDTDFVISTLPVRTLTALLGDAPEEVTRIARDLTARSFLTAAVLVNRVDLVSENRDCWVYVQEPGIRMGRFQIYNNWSPDMVEHPDNNLLLGFEYFCDENDELWNLGEAELCALALDEARQMGILRPETKPLAEKRCAIRDAYPTYGGTYPRRGEVADWLAGLPNLACAGRQGLHSYSNMDAAMESGLQAARNALRKLSRDSAG